MSNNFDYFIAYAPNGEAVAEGEVLGFVEAQAKHYCDKTGESLVINGYMETENRTSEDGRFVSETLLTGETELLTITPN